MWLRVWVNDETRAMWEIHGTEKNPNLHTEMKMMKLAVERVLGELEARHIIKKFMVLTQPDEETKNEK